MEPLVPSIPNESKSSGLTNKTTSPTSRRLTHADRCDAGTTVGAYSECGARAYYAAYIPSPTEGILPLFFCAHHFRRHEDALREAAVLVTDERYLLDTGVREQKRADH